MATITQRKNGSWQAEVRRRGHPRMYNHFSTERDARDWAAEVERRIKWGLLLPSQDFTQKTFGELAEDFKKKFAPHHYRGEGWKHKLKPLVKRLGKYSLPAITPAVIAKYRDDRLTEPDPRFKTNPQEAPKVSGATVKSEIDLLSKIFDVAQKEFSIDLPSGNPVKGVRKPKSAKSRDRRLSAKEWSALESECKASGNLWLHPAMVLAVETAMRQGELLQLKWENIDRTRRLALLLDPEMIKTEEPRAVPLSSRAIEVLEGLPRALEGRVIPIDRMTLYKAFERACERSEVNNYTWHDLRHEALSRLAERGDFSVLEMAAISGHKTLQMLKRYTHLQAENLAKKLG